MNASASQPVIAPKRRLEFALMTAALIGFALLMFGKMLFPEYCLCTTDDNIGMIKVNKAGLPGAFLGGWSDSVYLGMPGGIAPVMWNALLIWLAPVRLYINWAHAFDLTLASCFLVLFLRAWKVGWAAIGLGVLTAFWLGSNLTLTYAGHLGKYGVLLFAGIALFCLARALSQKTSLPWSIIAGGAIGLMFLEQLDVALFFGFVIGAYAVFLAFRQWLAHGTWLKSAVALGLMGGAGLLLAASTMLSGYASNVKGAVIMQKESPREKWDYVTQWSVPPDETIDLIAPHYFGIRSGEPEGPYRGRTGQSAGWEQTHQGFMNFRLESIYIGAIPVALALFAVAAALLCRRSQSGHWRKSRQMDRKMRKGSGFGVQDGFFLNPDTLNPGFSDQNSEVGSQKSGVPPSTLHPPPSTMLSPDRRAEILFWGAAALVTLLLAYGRYFPLYALFYQLPMVNAIRNPNKFIQIFQICLGILAAYGLDAALKNGSRRSEIGDQRSEVGNRRSEVGGRRSEV